MPTISPSDSRVSSLAALLVVAFGAPFLVAKHMAPMPTFYGEWVAGLLGTVVIAVLAQQRARGGSGCLSPWVALAPLWLILATIVQAAMGMPDVTGSRLGAQVVLTLGVAMTFAAWRASHSMTTEERGEMLDGLAEAFVLAGLFGVLAQWVQVFRLESHTLNLVSEYVFDDVRRPWGNLNQANHQATVEGLALVGSVWLSSRGRLRFAAWLVAAMLLESGIVLSASRTGVAHVGIAATYALLMACTARGATRSSAILGRPAGSASAAVVMIGLLLVLHPAIQAASKEFGWRLFDAMLHARQADQFSDRRSLWMHAWAMFRANPWLGVGFGEYGWAQFEQMAVVGVVAPMSFNAHNVVLDMLAKTGLVGTTGVAVILIGWLWRISRDWLWRGNGASRAQAILVLSWLAMFGIHSMVEFPLDYVYFLLPFCFLLGWLETGGVGHKPPPGWMGVGVLTLFLVVSLATLFTLWRDFRLTEVREYSEVRSEDLPMPHFWFRERAAVQEAEQARFSPNNAARWLPVQTIAIHLLPLPDQIARGALLLALTKDEARARQWMERLHYYQFGQEHKQFGMLADACRDIAPQDRPKDFCAWAWARSVNQEAADEGSALVLR